jgi:hypothetical protein
MTVLRIASEEVQIGDGHVQVPGHEGLLGDDVVVGSLSESQLITHPLQKSGGQVHIVVEVPGKVTRPHGVPAVEATIAIRHEMVEQSARNPSISSSCVFREPDRKHSLTSEGIRVQLPDHIM